jgi:hypothetical protein
MKLKEYQKKEQQLDFFRQVSKPKNSMLKKGIKISCLSLCAFIGYHVVNNWNTKVDVQTVNLSTADVAVQFSNTGELPIPSNFNSSYDVIETEGNINLGKWVKSFGSVVDATSVQEVALDMAYLSANIESNDKALQSDALSEMKNSHLINQNSIDSYMKEIDFLAQKNVMHYDLKEPVYVKSMKIHAINPSNPDSKIYEGTLELVQNTEHFSVNRYLRITMSKNYKTGEVTVTSFK